MSNQKKIIALTPNSIQKHSLIELGSDPNLDHFQVVCHWKDGTVSCGWGPNLTHEQMVFGAHILTFKTEHILFANTDTSFYDDVD